MTAPINCPQCAETTWRTSWTGSFYEEQWLVWQTHVAKPTYELTFEDEDQYETNTEPWCCANCGHEPDNEIQDALAEALK